MPTRNPAFIKQKKKRQYEKIRREGVVFPPIYVSQKNYKVGEAVAYWKENRQNISDKICSAIITAFEKERAESKDNNMLYYMEEHQRRLLSLPRIQDYYRYLGEGNPTVTKLFEDKAITEEDVWEISSTVKAIQSEFDECEPMRRVIVERMLKEFDKR